MQRAVKIQNKMIIAINIRKTNKWSSFLIF